MHGIRRFTEQATVSPVFAHSMWAYFFATANPEISFEPGQSCSAQYAPLLPAQLNQIGSTPPWGGGLRRMCRQNRHIGSLHVDELVGESDNFEPRPVFKDPEK